MFNIFVIEDNEVIRESIVSYLKLEGYNVSEFGGIAGVLEKALAVKPDLIILDVMLPDGNGFLLAKQIRHERDIPLIFLTARVSESDRITGLEIGAEDYIVKPFSPRELVLRIKTILKRIGKTEQANLSKIFQLADTKLVIDQQKHNVTVAGLIINLTAAEWKILLYLSENAGNVISREQLLAACLDYFIDGVERTIDTHIKNIRAKLGKLNWIETVRAYGYRFIGRSL